LIVLCKVNPGGSKSLTSLIWKTDSKKLTLLDHLIGYRLKVYVSDSEILNYKLVKINYHD